MVLVQKWPFFQFFFQAIQARKISFTIFQNEKTPIWAIKTRSLKSQKIDIFSKWLTHGFLQKMAIFPIFFRRGGGNIGQEIVFYHILERKNALLDYKNKKFKKSKNRRFSKGVNSWYWSKNGHFSDFSSQAIQARKMSFTIFQKKKPFQAITRRRSKSLKIDVFPKGLTHGIVRKMAIFLTFFFQAIQARKMSFTIFQNEILPFQARTSRFQKVQRLTFFQTG